MDNAPETTFIYNVTIKADKKIADEWLKWLRETHIPDIMNTNCFDSYKLVKLLEVDDSEGPTYAVQYHARSKADYNRYVKLYSNDLSQKASEKWGEQIIAFRSLMEIVQ